MEYFKANVQYNDWEGTCASDNADIKKISDFLKENDYISKNDFLIAIRLYATDISKITITALTYNGINCDDIKKEIDNLETIPVKSTEINISIEDFFKFFKRFSLILTHKSLDIQERTYEIT